MLDHQIEMEEIAIVPNIFLIYLHKDDYAGIKFLLKTLREQIIFRLGKEISRREKKTGARFEKLNKFIEAVAGFNISGGKYRVIVPDEWDISFQETERDVLVGDEIFEIQKGDICVVANFSEPDTKSANLASHLKTFVTIYKSDNEAPDEVVVETAKPTGHRSFDDAAETWGNAGSKVAESGVLAVLTCKYKDRDEVQTYRMSKENITVGREKNVDLVLLNASERISRRHLEINYKNDRFYLRNFGVYGTTIQGKPVPMSEIIVDNATQELNKEVELPARARVALAGGEVLIDFSRVVKS